MKTDGRNGNGFSRRTLLKGALGAAVAGAVPGRLLFGCDASNPSDTETPDGPRPLERRTLHFNLSHSNLNETHFLHIGGRVIELAPHTDETRASHRADNTFLASVPDEHLTHHVADLDLPADAVQSYQVRTVNPDHHLPALALAGIHIPLAGILKARRIKGPGFRLHHHRARQYETTGALSSGAQKADDSVATMDDITAFVDTYDAARFCMFHHSELMSYDTGTAAMVMSHIDSVPAIGYLAQVIGSLGPATGPEDRFQGWAYGKYSLDFDGNRIPQMDIFGELILDANGDPQPSFDFVQDPLVVDALGPAVQAALLLVRNDTDLEGEKYIIEEGVHNEDVSDEPVQKRRKAATGYGLALTHDGVWRYGQRVRVPEIVDQTVHFEVSNSYLRHLGVWAMFENAVGEALKLGDIGAGGDSVDTDYCKYLGMLDPPPRILGIPVVGMMETSETYPVDLPLDASRVKLVTSGLAFKDGNDWQSEFDGITTWPMAMTLTFEIGFPTLMLATGVAGQSAEKLTTKAALALGPIVLSTLTLAVAGQLLKVRTEGTTGIALVLINTVLKKSVGVIGSILIAEISEAAAKELAKSTLPIVGWVLFAIDVAVTLAGIINTIVDTALARSAVVAELSLTHDLRVRALPDIDNAEGFPAVATGYTMTLLFSNGATPQTKTRRLGDPEFPITSLAEVVETFEGVPVGGGVKVTIQFLSGNWVAGQGWTGNQIGVSSAADENGWIANTSPNGTGLDLTIQIEQQQVPLDASTVYHHAKRLTVDAQGNHSWLEPASAPTATLNDASCATGGGAALCEPQSITVSNRVGRVGVAWLALSPDLGACGAGSKGTQLYQAMNLNLAAALDGGAPDAARKVLPCGYDQPVHLLYSQTDTEEGLHFVLAPKGGVYYARKVSLDVATPIDAQNAPAWGQFASQRIRSAALHPSGYIAVLNGDYDKIEILRLRDPAATDDQSPQADLLSGRGSQRGNIDGGRAVAATHTGKTFLVLEDTPNRRIQALDETCNPSAYFQPAGAGELVSEVPLKDDGAVSVTYLDMSVAITGYIYVLSYERDGAGVDDYRLDIYERSGDWMARTRGLAAARMVVDHWQSVFAANWEMLLGKDGRAEPSISKWIPSVPAT